MSEQEWYTEETENDTKELWALQSENEEALAALQAIKEKLEIVQAITKWADEPGTFLRMGTLPRNLELVIVAMQKDLLKYTRQRIEKIAGEELPF